MSEERVCRNLKYSATRAYVGFAVWLALYFAPGIIIGRRVNVWAGLGWMAFGAAMLAAYAWKCMNPRTLSWHRDGFLVEDRKGRGVSLGWDKIHEAKWTRSARPVRKAIGPLLLLEPLWPLQRKGRMLLSIVHGGDPIELREDEYEGLAEFVEVLKKRNVPGVAEEPKGPPGRRAPIGGYDAPGPQYRP